MHQDPLLLLSPDARAVIQREWGIHIHGELNPYTRWMVEEEYKGTIENVRVERVMFSEPHRVGIGTFSPSDPKSQDISELIGSLDFVGIARYGTESDPRAYRFDGELNIANRGLMEFQEILKCDEKFLYPLLSLTQEGNFKTGRYALISADEVIVAHTNEAEYERFVNNPRNEALLSRMFVLRFPYHRSIAAETRMLQARVPQDGFEPDALETAAAFVIGTRSEDGMHGLDPRFVINCVSAALCNAHGRVDALDMLSVLKRRLPDLPAIDEDTLERYLEILHRVHQRYLEHLRDVVADSLGVVDEEKTLLQQYQQRLFDWAENPDRPDAWMQWVEDRLGVLANGRESFRQELLFRLQSTEGNCTLEEHPTLRNFLRTRALVRLKDRGVIQNALCALKHSPSAAEKLAAALLDAVNVGG